MARLISYVSGVVIALAGIWSILVPSFPMLGLFVITAVQAWVYLAIGLVLLFMAIWEPEWDEMVLKILGAVYLVLALLGFFVSGPVLGIFSNSTPDNVINLVIAGALLMGGLLNKKVESGDMSMDSGGR